MNWNPIEENSRGGWTPLHTKGHYLGTYVRKKGLGLYFGVLTKI